MHRVQRQGLLYHYTDAWQTVYIRLYISSEIVNLVCVCLVYPPTLVLPFICMHILTLVLYSCVHV